MSADKIQLNWSQSIWARVSGDVRHQAKLSDEL